MLQQARLQAIICCYSSEDARNFYVDKLGLRLKRKAFNGYVVDAGGGDLYLAEVPDPLPSAHTIVGFSVDNLDAALVGLAKQGIRPERIEGIEIDPCGIAAAPDGSMVAWFRDPDRNLFSIVQYPASFRIGARSP